MAHYITSPDHYRLSTWYANATLMTSVRDASGWMLLGGCTWVGTPGWVHLGGYYKHDGFSLFIVEIVTDGDKETIGVALEDELAQRYLPAPAAQLQQI